MLVGCTIKGYGLEVVKCKLCSRRWDYSLGPLAEGGALNVASTILGGVNSLYHVRSNVSVGRGII